MFKDFAIPTRIKKVSSDEELLELINKYNGLLNVYCSLYWYDIESVDEFSNEIRRPYIDKVFFDIDGDLESTKKLINFLIKEDLQFWINFSGRGHHIYIKTTGGGNATNLRIAQLSILHESGACADLHIIGDIARVSRIPNTWNFSANKYCVPIQIEELGKEDGSKQRFEKFIYGTQLLNLSAFTEDKFEIIKPEIIADMRINTDIVLLPCIRNIIKKINPTQTERYTLVVYLSNAIRNGKDLRGFDKYIIAEEIFNFFKENCYHWLDWNERITKYQIENIMPKTNIICGCKFLKSKGICIECLPGGI